MKIAFIDLTPLDFTPLTPLERPLGGMQSALCYLAVALAERGHDVSLINNTKTPGAYGGINCVDLQNGLAAAILNPFDIVVSVSAAGKFLRENGVKCPMVLWTGHDIDQRAVSVLLDGSERYVWNKIVMVSNWQAERYATKFKIKKESLFVLRNAIAPPFESVSRQQLYFFEAARPPVLIYSSTPFRGLHVLLHAFPLLRSLVPGCTARIYSSMAVYSAPEDNYKTLYDECRRIDGIEYCGSVSQIDLSVAYGNADIFAYPSIFMETSCISLMEAMASGCMVLSNDFGAISETAAGFGHLCIRSRGSSDEEFGDAYARFVTRIIQEAFKNPPSYRNQLNKQKDYVLKNYSWSARAVEWEQFLNRVTLEAPRTKIPNRNEPCPCGSGVKFKKCCGEHLKIGALPPMRQ